MSRYLPMTIGLGIRSAASRDREKIAIRCEDRTLRYGELAGRIERVTAAAVGSGLEAGTNVVLLAPNCLEYVEVVAGLSDAGLGVVTGNPRLTAPELRAIVEDSDARAIVFHPACEEAAREAGGIPDDRFYRIGDGYDAWRDAGNPGGAVSAVAEEATFAISYTSGTTGKPKGVMLSHRSRVLTFLAMAAEYGCYGPDDHALVVAPLYHGGGFAFGVAPLFTGGSCTVLPAFEPEGLLRELSSSAATNVFVVPTHVSAIFAMPDAVRERYRFPALRTLISNAAPLPQQAKERLVEHFGEGLVFECYGSTEAGIVSNIRPADLLRKRDSVGKPFPCTRIAVVDADGKPVSPGEQGEIYSRSPYLFNGYWGRPAETEAVCRDGWVTAGDLGRVDEEGFLYIEGRSKDMIISGGVNVYPKEIENVIDGFAGVEEAVVVGAPDPHWGERVVAFVVREAGSEPDVAALERFCKERLAGFKVPKEFRVVDEVPRNPTGKLLRRVLRDRLAATSRES